MPSTITHAYIGLDSLKRINKKPKDIINRHLNNYKIYCQNMDVLYFYQILFLKRNKYQEIGHTFHKENIYKSFELLINDNKKNKNEELFTFISGLITHYVADSTMHPYIDYLSYNDDEMKRIDKHFEIETYIDNYYINKYQSTNYKKFNNGKFIFNYTKEEIIKEEINKLFKEIYNINKIGIRYYQALDEMAFVFKYIRHDSFGIKKKFFQLIDLNPFHIRKTKYLSYNFNLDNDKYYLNLNHNTWFNYFNKENISNDSFLDLYDKVINKASNMINEVYEYIFEDKSKDLKKIIGNISYSTGLSLD